MTLQARFVPTQNVAQAWPQIEGFIAMALPYGNGDYTMDQIKLLCHTGQWSVVVGVDENNQIQGAVTVSYMNYPNDRVAFVTFVGGKAMTETEPFNEFLDILRANGATKTQCMARPSAARLWKSCGYEERSTLLEMKL